METNFESTDTGLVVLAGGALSGELGPGCAELAAHDRRKQEQTHANNGVDIGGIYRPNPGVAKSQSGKLRQPLGSPQQRV